MANNYSTQKSTQSTAQNLAKNQTKNQTKNSPRLLSRSQQQLKRQREWVYLTHFLATLQLLPQKTISGSDDGKEADFTCIFATNVDGKQGSYVVGIELTTLPRLRDRLGNDHLMLKRWYWQTQLQMVSGFTPTQLHLKNGNYLSEQKINQHIAVLPEPSKLSNWLRAGQDIGLALGKKWLPSAYVSDMTMAENLPVDSVIDQQDIDAVMIKKASKAHNYRQRRKLDELWLLIHTNEQQENGILALESEKSLYYDSNFDRVFLTRYPNQQLMQANRTVKPIIKR